MTAPGEAPGKASGKTSGRAPDWTAVTDDPNDAAAQAAARAYLLGIRRVDLDVDVAGFIDRLVAGKSVLDIGVVSHARSYFDLDTWRHGRIAARAARCVGLDILAPLVRELVERGYDVRVADATSDADLGERFEVVFIGDVVEHVDDPVALLRFAARHLAPGGRIVVSTPNAFSRNFVRKFMRDRTAIVNLDHVRWVTPTMAMEIGRRAGAPLRAIHLVKPVRGLRRALKRLAWRFEPVEYSFHDYLYEFGRDR